MLDTIFCRKIKFVNTMKLRPDYTVNGTVYQLVMSMDMPMDIGEMIPADDSVRLFNAVSSFLSYSNIAITANLSASANHP